jgi:CDGSH-type Zn-finger protein
LLFKYVIPLSLNCKLKLFLEDSYDQENIMTTKIKINNNGSIKIEGDFEITDANGSKFDLGGRTAISLCRCGASEKKPFCDGAHSRCGFESQITAYALPPKAAN